MKFHCWPLLFLTGACTTAMDTVQRQDDIRQLPGHINVRQVHNYSDFATFSIEELPYLAPARQTGNFGIRLIFDDQPSKRIVHTVYFDTASARLSESEKRKLDEIAEKVGKGSVYLSGYADPRGSKTYNDKLSKSRVNSVATVLERKGFSINRTCSYGETKMPDYLLCEQGDAAYE